MTPVTPILGGSSRFNLWFIAGASSSSGLSSGTSVWASVEQRTTLSLAVTWCLHGRGLTSFGIWHLEMKVILLRQVSKASKPTCMLMNNECHGHGHCWHQLFWLSKMTYLQRCHLSQTCLPQSSSGSGSGFLDESSFMYETDEEDLSNDTLQERKEFLLPLPPPGLTKAKP